MKKASIPKWMFASMVLLSIGSAMRIADKLPAGRGFETVSLMVSAMLAGMFLEKWRRPEEEDDDVSSADRGNPSHTA